MTEVTVEEDVGDVQLCVVVMEPSAELPFPPNLDFTLTATIQQGSAGMYVDGYSQIELGSFCCVQYLNLHSSTEAHCDYSELAHTMIGPFNNTLRHHCLKINIIDDLVLENGEDFTVRLDPGLGTTRVSVDPDTIHINITDNDSELFSISAIYQILKITLKTQTLHWSVQCIVRQKVMYSHTRARVFHQLYLLLKLELYNSLPAVVQIETFH